MKILLSILLVLGLDATGSIFNCLPVVPSFQNKLNQSPTVTHKDQVEIQKLIRQVLKWSDSKSNIELLPFQTNKKGTVYIALDLNKHNANLKTLQNTGLFSKVFINNYNQIILTLDKKLKNKETEVWLVGEMSPFNFPIGDSNSWCSCQDVPYDNPNPWDLVLIETVKFEKDKGEFKWKWGEPELNGSLGWKEFRYSFKTIKEDGIWKISYLEGFDLKKATK